MKKIILYSLVILILSPGRSEDDLQLFGSRRDAEKEKSNNTLKGDLIKSTFITSTMGVSYKVKLGKNI